MLQKIHMITGKLNISADICCINNNKSLSYTVDKYFSPNPIDSKGAITADLWDDEVFRNSGDGRHHICAAVEQNCYISVVVCDLAKLNYN